MSFLETPQFPATIQYSSAGGPRYNTDIVVLQSGHEQRNANWTIARHSYNVNNVKVLADIEAIIAHYHAMQGSLHGFRFKDWMDYKSCVLGDTVAYNDQTLGATDGTTATFQLIKNYTAGALTYARDITKPVSGTVKVGWAGAEKTEGVDWTVDTTTGVVSLISSPLPAGGSPDAITAGYEFDVPARFNTDALSIEHITKDIGSTGLPIIEIRA